MHGIMSRVHLIVPFASPGSAAGHDALSRLATPALDALLAGWQEIDRDEGDELTLCTPHERALAKALGWRSEKDAPLPWAARPPIGGRPTAAAARPSHRLREPRLRHPFPEM